MLTAEKAKSTTLLELQRLPEVEYPAEVVHRWKQEAEIATMKSRRGELKTFEELAAEIGYTYNE